MKYQVFSTNKKKNLSVGFTHTPKDFGVTLQSKSGFTLVEVMIALGLFTVVMIIGIGAILGVNSTHRKTQSMRAVIDNLSFVMEDMARSIRLGQNYYCKEFGAPTETELNDGGQQASQDGGTSTEPCASLAFEPYWDYSPNDVSNQVIYYFSLDPNGIGTIYKKEFDNSSFDTGDMLPITPPELNIDIDRSGFVVVGSQSQTDNLQPRVLIILIGTVRVGSTETEFNMQTTVSQRLLDITP